MGRAIGSPSLQRMRLSSASLQKSRGRFASDKSHRQIRKHPPHEAGVFITLRYSGLPLPRELGWGDARPTANDQATDEGTEQDHDDDATDQEWKCAEATPITDRELTL